MSMLLGYFIPPFKWLPIPSNRSLAKALSTIHEIALRIMRRHPNDKFNGDNSKDRSIVGVMIQENRKSREMGMEEVLTEKDLIDQIKMFLAAGFLSKHHSVNYLVKTRYHLRRRGLYIY